MIINVPEVPRCKKGCETPMQLEKKWCKCIFCENRQRMVVAATPPPMTATTTAATTTAVVASRQ
jgi:hypothetical protein